MLEKMALFKLRSRFPLRFREKEISAFADGELSERRAAGFYGDPAVAKRLCEIGEVGERIRALVDERLESRERECGKLDLWFGVQAGIADAERSLRLNRGRRRLWELPGIETLGLFFRQGRLAYSALLFAVLLLFVPFFGLGGNESPRERLASESFVSGSEQYYFAAANRQGPQSKVGSGNIVEEGEGGRNSSIDFQSIESDRVFEIVVPKTSHTPPIIWVSNRHS